MKPTLAAIIYVLIFLELSAAGSVFSQTPTPTSTPTSVSPDKQWRYVGGDASKLVKTATNEVTLEFSGNVKGDFSPLVWAPDSRRFAVTCAGGKGNSTLVYQLRNGSWEMGDALGNGDDIMDRAGKVIEAQAKKKGMPKKTFLHMTSWTVEPQKWINASTLIVYAAMSEVAHRSNGEYAGFGFGTDLLLTLKFDDGGAWEIIKTHQMSAKEVKEIHSRTR